MKHPWEKFRLTRVGNVADIVRLGGGKTAGAADDPGESNKLANSE